LHKSITILPCVIALLLSACGGGGGGTAPVEAPPVMLKLASTSPGNAATVGADTLPAVTFDAAPDPATITAQSVALRSPIGPVDSRVTLNGNTVTVTPAAPLVWGSHYKVNLSDSIRGAGSKLAATFFGFDTRMPTWSAATKVGAPSTGTTPGTPALTGGARNGDAVAVWGETTDSPYTLQLMLQRYSAATGAWTTPLAIKDSRALQSDGPSNYDLSVNGAGEACVAWIDNDIQAGSIRTIKAVRLDAAGGWTTPAILWTATNNATDAEVRVAIGENGDIVATWAEESVDRSPTIYAANYDAGTRQWSPPHALRSAAPTAQSPVVRIHSDGTTLLLWAEKGSTSPAAGVFIHAARYDAVKKTWGAAVNIQGDNIEDSLPSDVAFDSSGNAIATWFKLASSDTARTGAARYNAATGTWGKPSFFSSSTIEGSGLAMDAAGNALLVRTVWSSPTSHTFESSRYEQSSDSWISLPSQNLRDTTSAPRMDAAGNGLLTWVSHEDKYTINVMRYNADKARWDAPQVVASDDGYIENPILTTDRTGQALLVWTQHVGDSTSPAQVAYSRLTGR
jgi:hypothetical protein